MHIVIFTLALASFVLFALYLGEVHKRVDAEKDRQAWHSELETECKAHAKTKEELEAARTELRSVIADRFTPTAPKALPKKSKNTRIRAGNQV
jgi:hypothetical protein